MKTVSDIGEDALIQELIKNVPLFKHVIVGPGDDCAVLANSDKETFTLLKTDSIIEDVHFLKSTDPYRVGWKAVARVVSDFAAMGGAPEALVVALAIPADTLVDDVKKLYEGMYACAEDYQFSIVGGETSMNDKWVITVSGTGSCHRFITRSNAQEGDFIFVTGELGGSIEGKHLDFKPRVKEAAWLSEYLPISAMMDLSDGLGKDLPRLAKASKTGFHIDTSRIPCSEGRNIDQAIGDGEDYELLFTAPIDSEKNLDALMQHWNSQFPLTKLTRIGEITNQVSTELKGGWEYFSTEVK